VKNALGGTFLPRLELHQLLQDLHSGHVLDADLPVVLRCFGDGLFLSAMEDVESGVRSVAPGVRCAALSVLASRWQLPQHQSLFEFLLRHDEDGEVRALAARGLGVVLKGSRDRDTLRLLASVVSGSEQPESVRSAAYYAAFRVAFVAQESRAEVAPFVGDDPMSAVRVSALISEPASGLCARCGRPRDKAGDGPVWCLDCALEMFEPSAGGGDES
jgi:hypothetical protein